jgi:hypothetical protein
VAAEQLFWGALLGRVALVVEVPALGGALVEMERTVLVEEAAAAATQATVALAVPVL